MRRILFLQPFVLIQLLALVTAGAPPLRCHISVTGGETHICQGQPLMLIAKVDEGFTALSAQRWETEGNLLSDPQESFVKLDTEQPGLYQIKYLAWDEEGRQALCEVEINVAKAPEFEIVENFGIFHGILFKKPKLLIQINSMESHTFQWYLNGSPMEDATGDEFKPSAKGTYHAKVTSPLGCNAFSEGIIIE